MKKILLFLCLLLLLTSCHNKSDLDIEIINGPKEEKEVYVDDKKQREEEYKLLNEQWDADYYVNQDFIGYIKVGNLIDLPFVQGKTNDTYLRRDWYTMNYDEEGSIFLDYRNYLDDQNVIIYGHYVYSSYEPSGTHKFTPLKGLLEQANYEDNKYITLQLKDEIRTYEIAIVFYIDTYEIDGYRYPYDGYEYYLTEYEDDYFDYYISNAYNAAFYDTNVEVTKEDKLLTLQTCVENHDNLREIVLAKLIETEKTR